METQKKIKVSDDRLSDLPDEILVHILSMLPNVNEIIQTSELSNRWRFLWKSVPVSLDFYFPEDPYFGLPESDENEALDFIADTHRELHYWLHFANKIKKLNVIVNFKDPDMFVKDVDLWVFFATKIANVEEFELECVSGYEFPQFAYENTSLRRLFLKYCEVDTLGNVNWSSLVSLSFGHVDITGDFMEKVLAGCPNLECLRLEFFGGIRHLEISNAKLRKLTVNTFEADECDVWIDIVAPYIQILQLLGSSCGIRLRNVTSLVTVVIDVELVLDSVKEDKSEKKEFNCLKELLQSVAHVKNLELGPWCIKYMSKLALEGWQSQPLRSKFLKFNTNSKELDFPGICCFLQSSSHLETLVIDWYNPDRQYVNFVKGKDKGKQRQSRRVETHMFNCPLLHLKTIKFINLFGPLNENTFVFPLVNYLLENAIVLEKFDMAVRHKGIDMPLDHIKIEQELLSFPRSSSLASLVFSYQ
ncbi:unnamed protein product [Withania somnifera]